MRRNRNRKKERRILVTTLVFVSVSSSLSALESALFMCENTGATREKMPPRCHSEPRDWILGVKYICTCTKSTMETKKVTIVLFLLALVVLTTMYVLRVGALPTVEGCQENWKLLGNPGSKLCYENCPSGWTDRGLFCQLGNRRTAKQSMSPGAPPLTDEQAEAYLNAFADLKAAFKNDVAQAKEHYRVNGFKEGRKVPEPVYVEGSFMSCQGGDGKVYQYMGGLWRHYPSPQIASPPIAGIRVLSAAECARLPKGMSIVNPYSLGLVEGMSISCQGDGKVYRYTGGMRRHYPDRPTASAWNPNWENIRTLSTTECASVPIGPVMEMPIVAASTTTTPPCVPNSCHDGWKNIGGLCYENCLPGWTDQGLYCRGRNSSGQMASRQKKKMARKCIVPSAPPPDNIPDAVVQPASAATSTTTVTPCVPNSCHDGWKDIGGICYENCLPGWTDQGLYCRGRNSSGQMASRQKKKMARKCIVPTAPPPDNIPDISEVVDAVAQPCVPNSCHDGWKNIGGICYENCLPGWTDQGLYCRGRNSSGQMASRQKKKMARKCIVPASPPNPEDIYEISDISEVVDEDPTDDSNTYSMQYETPSLPIILGTGVALVGGTILFMR
jgi:hypothetical protein